MKIGNRKILKKPADHELPHMAMFLGIVPVPFDLLAAMIALIVMLVNVDIDEGDDDEGRDDDSGEEAVSL